MPKGKKDNFGMFFVFGVIVAVGVEVDVCDVCGGWNGVVLVL